MKENGLQSLQTVQNKALNFIGNYDWRDFVKTKKKHEEHQLKALSLVLHKSNKRIWKKLAKQIPEDVQELSTYAERKRIRFKKDWPSSSAASRKPPPEPENIPPGQ